MPDSDTIRINRAPVLSLWGAVVAERLGYDADEAVTLGEAVSVLNARSKGRKLGIFPKESAKSEGRGAGGRDEGRKPEEWMVDFLGRPVPAVKTPRGLRARIGDETVDPARTRRKLQEKFGDDYDAVREAMDDLAGSFPPAELAAAAYPLYERFRPSIPPGTRGWGAKGELDLNLVRSLARRPPAATGAKGRSGLSEAAAKSDEAAESPRRATRRRRR